MPLDVRLLESAAAAEVFITATPQPGTPPQSQVQEVFSQIREVLQETGARIFQERIFATADLMAQISGVRSAAYGEFDDGVPAALLAVPATMDGPFSGVQVHAVRSGAAPRPVEVCGLVRGRELDDDGRKYLALSALTAPDAGTNVEQARATFGQMEDALRQFGGDMLSAARTWMWLGKILDWYDEFNGVRSRFFTERGLMGSGSYSLPASTGMGIGPLDGGAVAMDLFALLGPEGSLDHLLGGGHQNPASDYGSAFSRASRAVTPGGQTVYVSGTAAIAPDGATEHVGDAGAQIAATVAHARAVLNEMGCGDDDAVQAIAYCKDLAVEETFRNTSASLSWPHLEVIGDICRPDLLFEIEVTACPGARKL